MHRIKQLLEMGLPDLTLFDVTAMDWKELDLELEQYDNAGTDYPLGKLPVLDFVLRQISETPEIRSVVPEYIRCSDRFKKIEEMAIFFCRTRSEDYSYLGYELIGLDRRKAFSYTCKTMSHKDKVFYNRMSPFVCGRHAWLPYIEDGYEFRNTLNNKALGNKVFSCSECGCYRTIYQLFKLGKPSKIDRYTYLCPRCGGTKIMWLPKKKAFRMNTKYELIWKCFKASFDATGVPERPKC